MSTITLYSDDELLVGMTCCSNFVGIYRKMPNFELESLYTSTSLVSVIEQLKEILAKRNEIILK